MLARVPPEVVQLERVPDDGSPIRVTRGRRRPRAIAWFGFSAFWGHLRHMVASAIATENIDSRAWMMPDAPAELLGRITEVLSERGARPGETLVDALRGEAWIDFVADTGDDVTVSEAVARMVRSTYEVVIDGETRRLPRGDVLLLGGDLAYPVATVREMSRRLIEPWNRVLEKEGPEPSRVLLAIPGNHDWYDGLDGFCRLVQAPCAFEELPAGDAALHPRAEEFPVLAWAEAFSRGVAVQKPGKIALYGYVPVQRASYFRLPLTRDIELFAIDRQLRRIDDRQQAYFRMPLAGRGRLLFMPDPMRAWGEIRPDGAAALRSIGVRPDRDPTLLIAGDVHHFERSADGPSTHVVSGGGGAFLQGARMSQDGSYRIDAEFPGPLHSRQLVWRLPWFMATGRSGLVVTGIFALANAFVLGRDGGPFERVPLISAIIIAAIVFAGTALLIGWRRHRLFRVIVPSVVTGVLMGLVPLAGLGFESWLSAAAGGGVGAQWGAFVLGLVIATLLSGVVFGTMLALIAEWGLNLAQPFAALGLPGFKQFLRIRVSEDANGRGSVEVFSIGSIDPLGGTPTVLVDHFVWDAASGARRGGGSEQGEGTP